MAEKVYKRSVYKKQQYKEVFSDGEIKIPIGIPVFLNINKGIHITYGFRALILRKPYKNTKRKFV